MKTIRIEGIKQLRFKLPEKWSEVTRNSFIRIAPLLLDSNFDLNTFRFKLLYALSNLSRKKFSRLLPEATEETELYNASAISELLKEVAFLQKLLFRTDLIKSIGRWPFKFRAVGNNLHRISFDQWLLANAHAKSFFTATDSKTNKKHLNEMFVSLYTPWFMPWRSFIAPVNRLFAHVLPKKLKYAILANFIGLKAAVIANNPHLFSKSGSKDPNFNELITELAGNKFGEVEKVGSKPASLILTYLNKTIRENENRK